MVKLELEDGSTTDMPLLPVALDGQRLQPRRPSARIGQHTREVMAQAGLSAAQIDMLRAAGVLRTED